MNDIQQACIHLNLIEGVGPATIEKIAILCQKHNLWPALYTLSVKDFQFLGNIPEKTAQKVVDGLAQSTLMQEECALLERHAISVVTWHDQEYPVWLKEIHLPPPVLYCHGNSALLAGKNIALVGSRLANSYAGRVIQAMVPPLIAHGYTIVSGGARGVDALAHSQALDAGGSTTVVLGSGLLRPYPDQNRPLFNRVIEENSLIISSFPLRMPAVAGNFPARNRIIAGIAQAVVVKYLCYE